MKKVETRIYQDGLNPFDYEVIELISQKHNKKLELVRGPKGKTLLRKTKKIKDDSDLVDDNDILKFQELQKREADFLLTNRHHVFPTALGYINGQVKGEGWVTSLLREWIPGESLDNVVKNEGALEIDRVIDYGLQIVEGLRYMHNRNHLFRDLKPSNVILRENSENHLNPWGDIELTDLDSMGRDEIDDNDGETIGVGSIGWTDPTQFGGEESVKTDFFALGTTLYYLTMGEQAEFGYVDGRYTIKTASEERLEKKLREIDSGPELARLIKRLVNPNLDKRPGSAKLITGIMEQLEKVCKHGYEAVDYKFKRFRKTRVQRSKEIIDEYFERFGEYVETAEESIRQIDDITFGFLRHPLGAGLTGAGLAGFGTYFLVSSFIEQKSMDRPVFSVPDAAHQADPITHASADIATLYNDTAALYVGLNMDENPSEVLILNGVNDILEDAAAAKITIAKAGQEMQPFQGPVSTVASGGGKIGGSYRHTSQDVTREECDWVTYTSQDCGTDFDGNYSCETVTDTRYECEDVYDHTNHWWRLNTDGLLQGVTNLKAAIEQMTPVVPKAIFDEPFLVFDAPAEDILGRPIVDGKMFLLRQNEWVNEGPIAYWNALSSFEGAIPGNENIKELFADTEAGLSQGKYPKEHYKENTSRYSDTDDAPEGYILVQRVENATGRYARNNSELNRIHSCPGKIDELTTELQEVRTDLEAGKSIRGSDLRPSADKASELYKTMVNASNITVPTASQQMGWSVASGVGAALTFGITAAVIVYKLFNRKPKYHW